MGARERRTRLWRGTCDERACRSRWWTSRATTEAGGQPQRRRAPVERLGSAGPTWSVHEVPEPLVYELRRCCPATGVLRDGGSGNQETGNSNGAASPILDRTVSVDRVNSLQALGAQPPVTGCGAGKPGRGVQNLETGEAGGVPPTGPRKLVKRRPSEPRIGVCPTEAVGRERLAIGVMRKFPLGDRSLAKMGLGLDKRVFPCLGYSSFLRADVGLGRQGAGVPRLRPGRVPGWRRWCTVVMPGSRPVSGLDI